MIYTAFKSYYGADPSVFLRVGRPCVRLSLSHSDVGAVGVLGRSDNLVQGSYEPIAIIDFSNPVFQGLSIYDSIMLFGALRAPDGVDISLDGSGVVGSALSRGEAIDMQRFFDRKLYIHANIEMSIPYGGSSLFCVLNGSVYCMGLYLSIAEFERYKEASFECEYDAARKCWDEPVGQVGGFPPKYQHDPYDFACYRLGMKDKYIKNINNIQFVANFPQVFELEFGDGGALSLYNVTQGEGSELRGFVEVP